MTVSEAKPVKRFRVTLRRWLFFTQTAEVEAARMVCYDGRLFFYSDDSVSKTIAVYPVGGWIGAEEIHA
jgi:hypothetical protein